MSWRVSIVTVFVLLLFGVFAYVYVNTFVRRHQPGVVLFVVEGLDFHLLESARQQAHPLRALFDDPAMDDARLETAKESTALNLEALWNVAWLHVQTAGGPVPDEAADATALACGARVPNGSIAQDAQGVPLLSLMDEAQKAQRSTGLITTGSLADPVPAAFYTHGSGVMNKEKLAADLLDAKIDLILGGGLNEVGSQGGDVLTKAHHAGALVLQNADDVRRAPTWYSPRMLGIFAPGAFIFTTLVPKESPQPSLAQMTTMALASLNHSINSYFLVVHEERVALAARQNLTPVALAEVGAVDEAIQSAIEYAGPDALILVTDDESLGALGKDGTRPFWLAGPGGPLQTDEDRIWWRKTYGKAAPEAVPQPACFFQRAATPTAEPAWLASRGDGSDQFRGFLNNTDLYRLIVAQF